MKTKALLVLSLILSLHAHAQISGCILATDRTPVPYVNIIALTEPVSGTTTDEEGAFHFDIRKPVDLYISAVGFRDTIIQCHPSQPQELILQKKDYALAEVIVTPYTHMPMLIGYPDAEPMEGWRACIPASGDGIFYTPQKKEIGAFLSSMQMYIYPMGKPQTPMAIRLMAPKHSHFKRNQVIPTTDFVDLLPEPLLLKAEQPGWQTIDLAGYNLQMPAHGLVLIYYSLDSGGEYKWRGDDGGEYYGAMVAWSTPGYPRYQFVRVLPFEKKLYILSSPLLKKSKPLIVFHLNENDEK